MNLVYLLIRPDGDDYEFMFAITPAKVYTCNLTGPNLSEGTLLLNSRRWLTVKVSYGTGSTKNEEANVRSVWTSALSCHHEFCKFKEFGYELITLEEAEKFFPAVYKMVEKVLVMESLKA